MNSDFSEQQESQFQLGLHRSSLLGQQAFQLLKVSFRVQLSDLKELQLLSMESHELKKFLNRFVEFLNFWIQRF
jgi:hypothetical protein